MLAETFPEPSIEKEPDKSPFKVTVLAVVHFAAEPLILVVKI
jgi:hypothetical protein|nr:MAG TPA: hypothetical protein [Bacteriophage sp.]